MAKKSRRARRRSGLQQSSAATTPRPVASKDSGQGPPTSPRKAVDFAVEYSYVYQDLRAIALIALLLLVVLFGLSYLIT